MEEKQKRIPESEEAPSYSQELVSLARIAMPMLLNNVVVFLRSMISVACLGRLGELQLAGGALSLGFTNITGYSVLFGLASGMDPICAQAFGSGNAPLLGLTLRRAILLLSLAAVPIAALWLNLGTILLTLRQDAAITAVAATYCRWSLPDLAANVLLQPLRVYMRSQGLAAPLSLSAAAAVALHLPLTFGLALGLRLGVRGVALASVATNLNMVALIAAYLRFSGAASAAWGKGWARDSISGWRPLLSLALPSAAGICLEWWWYELLTIAAGWLPEPRSAVAAAAVLIQTTSAMYTAPLALSAAASTRVGAELGAGRHAAAARAATVAVATAAAVAASWAAAAAAGRRTWGHAFTAEARVLRHVAAALPLLGACELGNCPQTAACGVLRGSARPRAALRMYAAAFYGLGAPLAALLAFRTRLGFQGLWYGLLAAQVAMAAGVLLAVVRTDWRLEAARAASIAAGGAAAQVEMILQQGEQDEEEEEKDAECASLLLKPGQDAAVGGAAAA